MAIIYFKKALVSTALDFIKSKGTVDKQKEKNDIDWIDSILNSYYNGYGYDSSTAYQLDERIRREYPIIESMNHLQPSKASCPLRTNPMPKIDPIISNLNQDRYGIIFSILYKEELVRRLEDFVDRVE